MFLTGFLTVLLNSWFSNGAVLIWSNKDISLSPLKSFDSEDLEKFRQTLNSPQIFVFNSPAERISSEFESLLNGFNSAYNPNGELSLNDSIELLGNEDEDKLKIKQILSLVKDNDFIAVLNIANKRFKRDVELSPEVTTETRIEPQGEFKKPEGPVIYVGKSKQDLYTLLYSSQPLLLKIKDEKIYLGSTSPDMITVDTRLNVNIPIDKGNKVTLRFSFVTKNGYWSLTSVKITITKDQQNFNLTANNDIQAPTQFSYHCNGKTTFSDKTNGVELTIFDLQVQIDSKNGKFGDVNDCVPFTTGPIWSGLFVTSIFGIGLIIALTAILDIKTMDKFDNSKTKNLSITVID